MKQATDKICNKVNKYMSGISELLDEHGIIATVGSVVVDTDQIRYEVILDTSKKTRAFKKLKPDIAQVLHCSGKAVEICQVKDNKWNIITPTIALVERNGRSVYIIQNQETSGPFYSTADDFIMHAFEQDMLSCFYVDIFNFTDMDELVYMTKSLCLTEEEVEYIGSRLLSRTKSFLIFVINESRADEQFLELMKKWELNSPYQDCIVFTLP